MASDPTAGSGEPRINPVNTGNQGWSAMASVVREVDEQKIKDCKEDIDTILVFAGLFSGALTAFLVESYQTLLQDPMDTIILLLQQIASQNNSTTAPPISQPAFQPTKNAIRVNVLWFGSFTLALVSASFAILVKQWLREYLSGEYTSPQARLRVRHFRNPGLDDWKVFEITAILPLLLQLSLALFLIGLCFFTAEVHSTIGHTTIPLVAAWGFLFVAASFAPVLSPRCPYKTSLLKSVTKVLRKELFLLLEWLAHDSSSDLEAQSTPHIPGKWSYKALAYDESIAVTTASNDLDILVTVDSIQSDDHLLDTMTDALLQSQLDPAQSIKFALKIIGRRMQLEEDVTIPSSGFLDLRRLPAPVTTTIMRMAGNILEDEIKQQSSVNSMKPFEWYDYMKDCVFILFAETNVIAPLPVRLLLFSMLTQKVLYASLFEILSSRAPDVSAILHIIRRLQGALDKLKGDHMLPVLHTLVLQYYKPGSDVDYHTFIDVLKNDPRVPLDHVRFLLEFVVNSLTNEMAIQAEQIRWSQPNRLDQVALIIELSPTGRDTAVHELVMKVIQNLLLTSRTFIVCANYAMGLNRDKDSDTLWAESQNLFIEAVVSSHETERRAILENLEAELSWQWRRSEAEAANCPVRHSWWLDPVKTCHLLLRTLNAMYRKGLRAHDHIDIVHKIWYAIDQALRTVAGRHIKVHPDWAKDCLECIDTWIYPAPPDPQEEQSYRLWAEKFNESSSLFPDSLIRGLALFLPPGEDTTFSDRVRRLALLKQKQEENDDKKDPSPQKLAASPLEGQLGIEGAS